MKWIRVEVTIGDDSRIGALAETLRIPLAEAVGLCVLVFVKLPAHAKDGVIIDIPDLTLESWAKWRGKSRLFATAFREYLCSQDNIVLEWERINGARIRESEATAERVRVFRENKRNGAKATGAVTPPVRRTARLRTPSDVDGDEQQKPAGSPKDLSKGEARPHSRVEKSAHLASNAWQTATASAVVNRFTAKFYPRSVPERRLDIAKQMSYAMLSTGVLHKGEKVRAVDEEHLDDVCLEIMEDPPRDPSEVFAYVLAGVKATYLETLSARAKAAVDSGRVKLPPGMAGDAPAGATPLRGAIANVLEGLTEEAES